MGLPSATTAKCCAAIPPAAPRTGAGAWRSACGATSTAPWPITRKPCAWSRATRGSIATRAHFTEFAGSLAQLRPTWTRRCARTGQLGRPLPPRQGLSRPGPAVAGAARPDASIAHNPKLVGAYLSRALIHERQGQYREGVADCTQAVELDAKSPAVRLIRGVLHGRLEDYPAAVADLTEALRLDDRLALAYRERGLVYTLLGAHDQALGDCDRLLALEPGNARAYAQRSLVQHALGNVAKAVQDYARALAVDPHCLLAGWNPRMAEAAHDQLLGQLADYVDGLRMDPPAAAVPPTPPLVVLPAQPEPVAPAAVATARPDAAPVEEAAATLHSVEETLAPAAEEDAEEEELAVTSAVDDVIDQFFAEAAEQIPVSVPPEPEKPADAPPPRTPTKSLRDCRKSANPLPAEPPYLPAAPAPRAARPAAGEEGGGRRAGHFQTLGDTAPPGGLRRDPGPAVLFLPHGAVRCRAAAPGVPRPRPRSSTRSGLSRKPASSSSPSEGRSWIFPAARHR